LAIVQISFVDSFKEEYQRNNKAKGRKHLRCFPGCKDAGHIDNNYCGRPVLVDVTYRSFTAHTSSELVSFVEFRPVEQAPSIVAGKITAAIGKHWVAGITKSAIEIGSGLVKVQLSFNSTHKTWQYLWQSHRMTADTPHVLDVFVGTLTNGCYFGCHGTAHSPRFRLFCRKKTIEAEAGGLNSRYLCSI
jgi:hypothetical protein